MMKGMSSAGEYLIAGRKGKMKLLLLPAIIVTTLFMTSCIAVIPAALYARSASQTRTKAEVPAPADKVYHTAVEMARERGLKIVKQEDEDRYLEATDGSQTECLKAKAIGADSTELTVIAKMPSREGEQKADRKKREKEQTLRVMDLLCERLEVKYTVMK